MKRLIVIIAVAAVAASGIAIVGGCAGTRVTTKALVSAALKDAYALGGSTAVSNRIERLVVDGKLMRDQADALHTFAKGVYERILEDLDGTPCEPCEDDASCGKCDACRDAD